MGRLLFFIDFMQMNKRKKMSRKYVIINYQLLYFTKDKLRFNKKVKKINIITGGDIKVMKHKFKIIINKVKYKINLNKHLAKSNFRSILQWIIVPMVVCLVFLSGAIISHVARKQIEANTYSTMNDTITQTKVYLDNRMYEVFEQFVALENDSDLRQLMNVLRKEGKVGYNNIYYVNLDKTVRRILSSHGSIVDSIYLDFNDGDFQMQRDSWVPSDINFNYDIWKEKYPEEKHYWMNVLNDNPEDINASEDVGVMLFRLIQSEDNKLKGIIVFNLKKEFFKNILQSPKISDNGFLSIVTDEDYMVFKELDKTYGLTDKDIDYLLNTNSLSGDFIVKEESGLEKVIVYNTLNLTQWKLAVFFPKEEFLEGIKKVKYITMSMTIAMSFFAILLSIIVAKVLAHPIGTLIKKVKRVQDKDLSVKFDITTYQEVASLSNGLDSMLSRIKELLQKVEEEQEQKRKAEMSVLQAQIKPHFLYNTLYSVKQLCDMGEGEVASSMVSALSCFYRIGISRGQEIIMIKEELEHVKSYLYIQQLRYSDVFNYIIDCEDEILDFHIPKLSLQPLVENAIYHGVKLKRDQGSICIIGGYDEDFVFLEVRDDGMGFSTKRLDEVNNHIKKTKPINTVQGIGIINVHERIQLHFGTPYGIEITSIPGVDTCVRINLPRKSIKGVNQ